MNRHSLDETTEREPVGEGMHEEDQELLSIFCDFLQESFTSLIGMARAASEENRLQIRVDPALDVLESMIGSARYMGYDHFLASLEDFKRSLAGESRKGLLSTKRFIETLNGYAARFNAALPPLKFPHVLDTEAASAGKGMH
jgi:hypothetical protein